MQRSCLRDRWGAVWAIWIGIGLFLSYHPVPFAGAASEKPLGRGEPVTVLISARHVWRELPEGLPMEVDIRPRGVAGQEPIHLECPVGKPLEVKLLPGLYTIEAATYDPWSYAEMRFQVPIQTKVPLILDNPVRRVLTVKVIDPDGNLLPNVPIRLSIPQSRRLRFDGPAVTEVREVTDKAGEVQFAVLGSVTGAKITLNSPHRRYALPADVVVPERFWEGKYPFHLTLSPKKLNGKIQCLFRQGQESVPLKEGIMTLIGEAPAFINAQIVRASLGKDPAADYHTFLVEENEIILFGLPDDKFSVRRVVAFGTGVEQSLVPVSGRDFEIRNGMLVEEGRPLVLLDEQRIAKKHVGVTVTDGKQPLPEVSVGFRSIEETAGGKTDVNGRLLLELHPGDYTLTCVHESFMPHQQPVVVGTDDAEFTIQLEPYPGFMGGVVLRGRPVSDAEVIVSFGPKKRSPPVAVDRYGQYMIRVKEKGRCLVGVAYDGVLQFVPAEVPERGLRSLSFELKPRFGAVLRLHELANIGNPKHFAIFLVPEGMGEIAAGAEVADFSREKGIPLKAIEGRYELYLFTSGEMGLDLVHELGSVLLNQDTPEITLSIPRSPAAATWKVFEERLEARIAGSKRGE